MTVSLTTAVRNAKLDAITAQIGASGFLRIYDGAVPASANTALGAQVLLAELALSATFAPAAASGILTANAIATDPSADATGVATFYRIFKNDGTTVIAQGSVATSGGDLNLNTTSLVATGPVIISSFVFTEGNP
jgi:hypothetical protein